MYPVIRSLFLLILLITIPVILLFVLPPAFNPLTHALRMAAPLKWEENYSGVFILIHHSLKDTPEKNWPEHISQLGQHFGYPLQLIPLEKVIMNEVDLDRIKQGDTVVARAESPRAVYQRAQDSSWVIKMVIEESLNDEIHRNALGSLYLLESVFQEENQTRWPILLRDLQARFPYELSFANIDNLPLSPDQFQALTQQNMTWTTSNDVFTFYYRLNDSNNILVAGPVDFESNSPVANIVLIALIVFIICVSLLSWLGPLWRTLNKLDQKAQAFGKGELNSRIIFNKGSLVGRLAASFNTMADNIQNLIRSNQELTNAVAHDLRTPLARLRFAFEIIETKDLSKDEYNRYKKSIHTSLNTLDYLINQTLTHSRYSRAPDIKHFKPHNIAILLADQVETYSYEFEHIQFHLDIDEYVNSHTFVIDKNAFERLVDNLLSNASRFARDKISTSLSYQHNTLSLTIEDNGPGIPAEFHQKIFQPFAQVNKESRGEACGHGLGLAIVEQIAIWHKGSVRVRNATTGGACFEVFLSC